MSLMQRNFEVGRHYLEVKTRDAHDFLGPHTQTESYKTRC